MVPIGFVIHLCKILVRCQNKFTAAAQVITLHISPAASFSAWSLRLKRCCRHVWRLGRVLRLPHQQLLSRSVSTYFHPEPVDSASRSECTILEWGRGWVLAGVITAPGPQAGTMAAPGKTRTAGRGRIVREFGAAKVCALGHLPWNSLEICVARNDVNLPTRL